MKTPLQTLANLALDRQIGVVALIEDRREGPAQKGAVAGPGSEFAGPGRRHVGGDGELRFEWQATRHQCRAAECQKTAPRQGTLVAGHDGFPIAGTRPLPGAARRRRGRPQAALTGMKTRAKGMRFLLDRSSAAPCQGFRGKYFDNPNSLRQHISIARAAVNYRRIAKPLPRRGYGCLA